jgi:uncharacterized protein (DUF362 family)
VIPGGLAYPEVQLPRSLVETDLVCSVPMMKTEGNGPVEGHVVDMGLIIAGTNALATDMVAAGAMGFDPGEVPTFTVARALARQIIVDH